MSPAMQSEEGIMTQLFPQEKLHIMFSEYVEMSGDRL
jgi:hypothetical protein